MSLRRNLLPATLRRRFCHRLTDAVRGDSGSIMLAMLVMIVVTGVGMVVTPMFLLQVGTTRSDVARATQLTAARTGLDVAVGHLRAANDGAGNGVLAGLPCAALLGSTSNGPSGQYSAAVSYYASDPSSKTTAQLTTDALTCIAGRGTVQTPGYALVVSQGTDAVAPAGTFPAGRTRTLRGTYSFRANGGLIHSYPGNPDLCLDAGPTMPPTAGTTLLLQQCMPGAGQQSFTYGLNLTLLLTASATPAAPNGMCLDAGTPHALNALVTFQPCPTATVARQQWILNDAKNFMGTADGQTPDGYCFVAASPSSVGSTVVIRNSGACSGFAPETSVGTGAAGPKNGQLVNFGQSGYCLDVANNDVNAQMLISYPCKQSTNAVTIDWNQKWLPILPAGAAMLTGPVTTSPPGYGPYCLVSPLSIAVGQHVNVAPCNTADTGQTWTRYGNTGLYKTSYQITDGAGLCLQPTDPKAVPPDLYSGYSRVVVATCNGSTLQKWNAPPSTSQTGALTNVAER